MTEYIEREALIKSLEFVINDSTCPIHIAAYIEQIILQEPVVDVADVRHGYWYFVEYEYFSCSECGESYYNGCDTTAQAKEKLQNSDCYNYCPYCGAKMDEKGESDGTL